MPRVRVCSSRRPPTPKLSIIISRYHSLRIGSKSQNWREKGRGVICWRNKKGGRAFVECPWGGGLGGDRTGVDVQPGGVLRGLGGRRPSSWPRSVLTCYKASPILSISHLLDPYASEGKGQGVGGDGESQKDPWRLEGEEVPTLPSSPVHSEKMHDGAQQRTLPGSPMLWLLIIPLPTLLH